MIWRSPAVGQLRQRHFWWIPVKELGIKPATDKSCRIWSPQSSCRVDYFWHVFFVSWMPQFLTIQKTNPLSPHELGLKTRNRTPWLAGKIPHRHFHGVPVKKSPWLVRGIYRPCLSRFFRWWLCPCDPKKITIKPYMFPHESGFSVPKASAIWTKRPDTKRLERPGKVELAPKSMAKAVWEWSTWWMFMKFPYLLSLSLDFPYRI